MLFMVRKQEVLQMVAVFFPADAHWGKVQSAAAGPQHVRKVCIKIAVDTL